MTVHDWTFLALDRSAVCLIYSDYIYFKNTILVDGIFNFYNTIKIYRLLMGSISLFSPDDSVFYIRVLFKIDFQFQ